MSGPTLPAYKTELREECLDQRGSSTNNDFSNASTNRVNFELYDHTDESGSTYSYSQKLTGATNQQVGVAKSFKVYPGDKIKIEAYAKYMASSGSSDLAGFATALLAAFGYSTPPGGGETGTAKSGLNTWGAIVAGGGGNGSGSYPKAFVNLLVFDQQHNLLDAAWNQINGGEQVDITPKAAHDYMMQEYTAKEAGYIYVYVSNENSTLVDVYFDDVVVTQTKTNLIQGNEYYPFGMQTANSWTRESVTGNNYLANGATEYNTTSQLYDLDFRNYDPALGRMYGVDPMASKYSSLTPYNYSFNNPIAFSDPSGADPEDPGYKNPNHNYYFYNGNGAMGVYGLTYDDRAPNPGQGYGDYNCAYCWRKDNVMGFISGAGQGIVRDAGGSSGWTLRMGNMTINYNDLEDGSHYFAFENGIATGYNYMSTGDLFHEAGMIIARGYYGGNGSMPAGYVPANHRPRIALPMKNIVVARLPAARTQRPDGAPRSQMLGSIFASAVSDLAGKPYKWGEEGIDGADCSGTIIYGLRQFNSSFERLTANGLFDEVTRPTTNNLPGSLMFYDWTGDGIIDHVTTILDATSMLHPSSGNGTIEIRPQNYLDGMNANQRVYLREIIWSSVNLITPTSN